MEGADAPEQQPVKNEDHGGERRPEVQQVVGRLKHRLARLARFRDAAIVALLKAARALHPEHALLDAIDGLAC